MMNGTESGPVVAPPESKAMETKKSSVNAAMRNMMAKPMNITAFIGQPRIVRAIETAKNIPTPAAIAMTSIVTEIESRT